MKLFKKALFSLLLFTTLGWGAMYALLHSTPDYAAMHKENVIIYGTAWCSGCAQTRKYLNAKRIPFFEYDIENSPEGQAQFKELHGNGTPLILVKRTVLRGFDPQVLTNALQSNQILQ